MISGMKTVQTSAAEGKFTEAVGRLTPLFGRFTDRKSAGSEICIIFAVENK
ncbi:MAG: hypothetical protein J6K38_07910 [Alistipes sp.]|nr:hypothetical protein [Alistipes sp.]